MATEVSALRAASMGTWGVFQGELRRWLGRRGLFHIVLWLVVVEWALYVNVATEHRPFGYIGFESLINILVILPMLVGIVLTAVSVCGSYHDGTIGWVLGKPVPRSGYLAATAAATWLGVTVTAIVIPGLAARWWLPNVEPYRFVAPEAPELSRFVAALGIVSLILGFFIALTTLLSVVIRRRGVVVAIGAWALLVLRLPFFPAGGWIDSTTPSLLIRTDVRPGGWSPIVEFLHNLPLDATSAVAGTAGLTVLFMAAAIVIFRRLEF